MKEEIKAEDFSIAKENKKDFKKSVIRRGNLTNEFTLEDLESHQTQLNKMERELTSQIKLSNAVVDNVARNHPFVSKMSEEALNAAAYLFETQKVLKDAEKKLKEVKETKKKYAKVKEAVYTKFNFNDKESNEA
jgi:hypothetical protein